MSETTDWPRGCIQVYTGRGKGKTTAALGLALRASGAGLPVYIAQFIKGCHYSELDALALLAGVEVHQFGRGRFVRGNPEPEDCAAAREGLQAVHAVLSAGVHRLVILDEINSAIHAGLVTIDDLFAVMDLRPDSIEFVCTGRNAHPRLIRAADLVTEMREIKHYFHAGFQARTGIEK